MHRHPGRRDEPSGAWTAVQQRRRTPASTSSTPRDGRDPMTRMQPRPSAITIHAGRCSTIRRGCGGPRIRRRAPWDQGTDLAYLQGLIAYWTDTFDWRAQERRLNGFHHFRAELDGLRIHFVHERAVHGDGVPLILTHGWPSSFAELLPLVPLLTDPRAHGIDGPGFDLVIPSLPGTASPIVRRRRRIAPPPASGTASCAGCGEIRRRRRRLRPAWLVHGARRA
jgi:hypothetical protein